MKIVISYVSAGAGHQKAAEAVYDYLKEEFKDDDIELADLLNHTNLLFRLIYDFGYTFLVSHFPSVWAMAFKLTSARRLRFFFSPATRIFNQLSCASFGNYLIRTNPEIVILTHFLPSEIAAFLKLKRRIKSLVITVITDFFVHPYWICPGTDIYIAGLEETEEQLVRDGVAGEKVKASGIPVNRKFLQMPDKEKILLKFGLQKDRFTILVMTGSFGFGPIAEIVESLKDEVQILVVTANNRKLAKELKGLNYTGVRVFGFIDNMQELMAAAEVIISKAGGLSVAEALISELIPIFISPIPGQEAGNIRILRKRGIGFRPRSISEIKNIVLNLKNNPAKMEEMRGRLREAKKPRALAELADVIRKNRIRASC